MCTVLLTEIVVKCMFLWGGKQRKRNRERQGDSDAIDEMPESLNVSASIDLKSAKLFVAVSDRSIPNNRILTHNFRKITFVKSSF